MDEKSKLIKNVAGKIEWYNVMWVEGEVDDDGFIDIESENAIGNPVRIRTYCEPEDAYWDRDLQDNYWSGLSTGSISVLSYLLDEGYLKESDLQDILSQADS